MQALKPIATIGRRRPSLIARITRLGLVLGFLGALGAGIVYVYLGHWGSAESALGEDVTIDFRRGTGLASLAAQLEQAGLVDDALMFSVWVRLHSDYGQFQAGLYKFKKTVSPVQIADTIVSGKIFEPIVVQYTIPEGFTYKKISERLIAAGIGSREEFDKLFDDQEFLRELQVPGKTMEGYFYPATYGFVKQISAREALAFGAKTFWEKLPADYLQRLKGKGMSLEDAVKFASLIELETLHDDERPMVSEVIWSRLKNREPLAIDASIIYGIPDYDGDIKWKHLRDKKNPYNTRKHRGLPPTAVGSPSISSLEAVLNPTNKGYYYYVRDVDTVNRHHFSKTRAEHNRFVERLKRVELRQRRARR